MTDYYCIDGPEAGSFVALRSPVRFFERIVHAGDAEARVLYTRHELFLMEKNCRIVYAVNPESVVNLIHMLNRETS